MKFNIQEMIASKTFWLGVGTIAGGVYAIFQGETKTGMEAIIAGLGLIFIKDAIVSSSK